MDEMEHESESEENNGFLFMMVMKTLISTVNTGAQWRV
jgi:hypothetical protein